MMNVGNKGAVEQEPADSAGPAAHDVYAQNEAGASSETPNWPWLTSCQRFDWMDVHVPSSTAIKLPLLHGTRFATDSVNTLVSTPR